MENYLSPTKLVILLATYNSEKYITEQLDSLFFQSYLEWTLYIHDDGSNDETLNIIKKYQIKHPNIILIDDDFKSLGPKRNFTHLLQNVKAEYYLFCDHDDIWLPNKVEITIKEIHKAETINPNKAIVFHSDLTVVDKDLNIINNSMWNYAKIKPQLLHKRQYVMVSCYMTGCTMGMNHKAKNDLALNMPDNAIMHDWWIGIQAVLKNAIIISYPVSTILYRLHGANDSGIPYVNKRFFLKMFMSVGFKTDYNTKIKPFLIQFGIKHFHFYKILYNLRRFTKI